MGLGQGWVCNEQGGGNCRSSKMAQEQEKEGLQNTT